jgi:large subunit ribosomal protein L30
MKGGKNKTIRITQVKSSSGRLRAHQACLLGLGIRRIRHTVEVQDTPENRGMIRTASYMLKVEEVA